MYALKEKLQLFKENAEKTTATVDIVSDTQNELITVLEKYIEPERDVLLQLENKKIIEPLNSKINFITSPSNENLTHIKTSITDCAMGLASTGSVLINNDSGNVSYLSMLTANHIVILNSSDIYMQPREVFIDQNLHTKEMSSFSLITGPSATADMGSLERGVHGPEKIHIIILSDYEQ